MASVTKLISAGGLVLFALLLALATGAHSSAGLAGRLEQLRASLRSTCATIERYALAGEPQHAHEPLGRLEPEQREQVIELAAGDLSAEMDELGSLGARLERTDKSSVIASELEQLRGLHKCLVGPQQSGRVCRILASISES